MTRSRARVADVLAEHVTFEVECIDRMYLQRVRAPVAVPRWAGRVLSTASSGCRSRRRRCWTRSPTASSPADPPLRRDQGVPWSTSPRASARTTSCTSTWPAFDAPPRGSCSSAGPRRRPAVFRTEKRRNRRRRRPTRGSCRATAMVNQFYFYGVDADFGPFFIKFCTYFPYTAKLCINGHQWAQRQAAKAGIGFTGDGQRVRRLRRPGRLQAHLRPARARPDRARSLRKWLARLPHPFTAADRRAGYRYDISILQAEFSLTQVLDRPLAGRVFFEDVIRDNLDVGRPDQVSLIFDRRITRRTPGRFRTRVITEGVIPSLHVDYKRSRIKQYHKEGAALRTETTINDTRDFDIGQRLPTCPHCGRSAFTPTDASCTSNESATTLSSETTPSPPHLGTHMATASPPGAAHAEALAGRVADVLRIQAWRPRLRHGDLHRRHRPRRHAGARLTLRRLRAPSSNASRTTATESPTLHRLLRPRGSCPPGWGRRRRAPRRCPAAPAA